MTSDDDEDGLKKIIFDISSMDYKNIKHVYKIKYVLFLI